MNTNIDEVIDSQEIDQTFQKLIGRFSGIEKMIAAVIVIIIIMVIIKIINKLIDKHVQTKGQKAKGSYMRIVTVMEMVKKIIKVLIWFIGIMILMGIFGLSISPLLATIGAGSVALGIGARDLVQDVINGFFIIFEDQYSVGDLIDVSGYSGRVEELGLRCTKLRDFDGLLHIIPNSQITIVTNKERGTIRTKITFPIAVDESPRHVIYLLEELLQPYSSHELMIQGPLIWGVTENEKDYNAITLVYYTASGDQYDLEHDIRERIAEMLIRENIKTPRIKNVIQEMK